MPVGVLAELQGVNPETYDSVNDEMDIDNNRPEGLIFHTAGKIESGMRIFDVWESAEDYERFERERLMPAVEKVGMGMDQTGGPPQPPEIYTLHNFMRP